MRRKKFSLLSVVVFVAAVEMLVRLVGFLLEVPSTPFGFRDGGNVLAGWILLVFLSVLALERLQTLLHRWRTPPPPPAAYDPYLMAVAEMENERADRAQFGGKKSA